MAAANFSSISPFLPLKVDPSSGLLQWQLSVEYALKAVARGPNTSHVTNALALYDCIEDLRAEIGDLKPLSPQVSAGLSRLFAEAGDAQEFFTYILPNIAELALQLPDLLKRHDREIARLPSVGLQSMTLRVLPAQQPGMVLLRQHLIAALLACGFFCLYPDGKQNWAGLISINFDALYQGVVHARNRNVQKLLCVIHYFKRVCSNMPQGTVSFERKVLPQKGPSSISVPSDGFWSDSKQPLCEMKVIQNGSIEEAGCDYLQVDFANEQLGGGALNTGCVQEEIRFMISPECIAGMMFLATMSDNESIEIIGAETYSVYSGYRQSFQFVGDHIDNTPRDSLGRRKTCIGAIDALCLPGESQFEDELMIRELDKAYCGFLNHSTLCEFSGDPNPFGTGRNSGLQGSEEFKGLEYEADYEVRLDRETLDNTYSLLDSDETMSERSPRAESKGTCITHQNLKGVATGNWGAGAFGGDLQLKSLLQWLAASQAGCSTVLYYCFDDPRSQRLQEVVDWILQEKWCVSELWSILQRYGKCRMNRQVNCELFNWILPQENMGFDMLNIV